MKATISLLIASLGVGLHGTDLNGFEHFSAPGIVGAHCDEWSPLGLTDKGFDFSVGFNLNDQNQSSSDKFWINKGSTALIEIDSIAAVNCVISDIYQNNTSQDHQKSQYAAINGIRILLSTSVASSGHTGLPLYFNNQQDLVRVISRLKAAGLDDTTASLLSRLGEEAKVTENNVTNDWNAVWYEIDRLGGIERVTIRGSLEPMKVVSIMHEAIYDAGKVSPSLLFRDKIFDINLLR